MKFTAGYDSPIGELLLASDGEALTGLWLPGQRYHGAGLTEAAVTEDSLPIFQQTKRWLDHYFAGNRPEPERLPLNPQGSTFRRTVWQLLLEIPYGERTTYGRLARRYQEQTGCATSARAIGGAVGHNPISIIIPCHRVVGADGDLTGYAGGLDAKTYLLALEQQNCRG